MNKKKVFILKVVINGLKVLWTGILTNISERRAQVMEYQRVKAINRKNS